MAHKEKGMFLPTTSVWDASTISNIKGASDDLKDLFIRLYRNINDISMQVNRKDSAIYGQDEFVCGQTYFSNPSYDSSTSVNPKPRQVYRKVINFGALPDTGTKNIPHGLTVNNTYSFTRIYGAASNQAANSYLPLPFASPTLASNISLSVDGTNIIIVTGSNRSAYTKTYVVLEYIKV